MTLEEFQNRIKDLENESYRTIRRKVSDVCDESNNDEIAGFVKGVVALQGLLYSDIQRQYNNTI